MGRFGFVRESKHTMMNADTLSFGGLRTLVFGISEEETTFSRRGFSAASPEVRERLERVGRTFVAGYHAALRTGDPASIAPPLEAVDLEVRGFAFEGAAMAFAILDLLAPFRHDRVRRFLDGAGAPHVYMIHVGAGWALARLRRPVEPAIARLDPLLGWLAVDGYGFHEGYFHHERTVRERRVPARMGGHARRVFDQGLGRSLWFVCGADVERIAATIAGFEPARRADLWSGAGLACAYAGGVPRDAIEALRSLAGGHAAELAQGAAFAAKARERAGNPAEHTEAACRVLCGRSAASAAAVTDEALASLLQGGAEPAYDAWRRRVRSVLGEEVSGS
jgi:hypothetical protein